MSLVFVTCLPVTTDLGPADVVYECLTVALLLDKFLIVFVLEQLMVNWSALN